MGGVRQLTVAGVIVVGLAVVLMATATEGFLRKTLLAIRRANRDGLFVGLVVPNAYEMDPVLNSPSFKPSETVSLIPGLWTSKGTDTCTIEVAPHRAWKGRGVEATAIAGGRHRKQNRS